MRTLTVRAQTAAGAQPWPDSDLILRSFRRTPEPDLPGAEFLEAAHGLAAVHERRYGLSIARREPGLSDQYVVAYMHKIDEIDTARAELVIAIDGWASRHSPLQALVVHTETVGTVVDRMAQLFVAMNAVDPQANSEAAHRSCTQLAELAAAYDDLSADIVAGHRRVPRS